MIYEKEKTKNISFPIGGIGTGCIGIAGNGELIDWEIFNRPNKCSRNKYSHFAIKVVHEGKSTLKVLQGDTTANLMGQSNSRSNHGYGYGPSGETFAGFPHFKNVSFDGTFPIANLSFFEQNFPATVRLCAFNPFIPHDDYNSSIPAAFFEFEVENTTNSTIRIALACTVCNPSNSGTNKKISEQKLNGVFLKSPENSDNPNYSDLCILTDNADTVTQEYWYRGIWQDGVTTYWKDLLNKDRMPERNYDEPSDHGDCSTVVSYANIPAFKKTKIRFVISWNVPIAYNYWRPRSQENNTWRNYYATNFKNSFASAKYALDNFDDLFSKTELFSDTLQSSTLPAPIKDAVSANLAVLKSPTVLRLEDGSVWGWEGCNETGGSCYGTCQHVWNYAYAMPYLFPKLERSIREITLKYALRDSGATSFRVNLPLIEGEISTSRACLDGQMGEVIKCYREWKFSGDDKWIEKHSEAIFKMIEYAWSKDNPDKWDADMDGVLEGRQHHTLDMELFGPSSWLQGLYLLALDCATQIAKHVGDDKRADLYAELYRNGKEWMNKNLFNGKYFHHSVDVSDKSILERFGCTNAYWNEEAKEIKYQLADGCIIDQMLADWHAALIGLRGVFDVDKKKIAIEHLFKNNFKPSMRDVANMWRNFAVDDEGGTIICSYDEADKIPVIPIPYCEETMTGFEYALAGLMIAEGYVAEGEKIAATVRERYDGEKRNPWNEIECGSNYVRSMASYAFMPIYSGFSFDMTKKHIGFAPIYNKGEYLFSAGDSWGKFKFDEDSYTVSVYGNPLTLASVAVPISDKIKNVTVDGENIVFEKSNGNLSFDEIIIHKELRLN